MSTELFLILRCEASPSDIHCENSITTSFSYPPRARTWARTQGWTTRQQVTRRRFRRRVSVRDLCPDHAHLRGVDLS